MDPLIEESPGIWRIERTTFSSERTYGVLACVAGALLAYPLVLATLGLAKGTLSLGQLAGGMPATILGGLVGGGLLIFGLTWLTYSESVEIDEWERSVRHERGWSLRRQTRTFDFEELSEVVVVRRAQESDAFGVLIAPAGARPIDLATIEESRAAIECGRKLARILGVPFRRHEEHLHEPT